MVKYGVPCMLVALHKLDPFSSTIEKSLRTLFSAVG